ncbi:MAG TPA: DUF6252 family protein [Mucilaginibacter sp.]|nr:DUF6252 family protein [Mucilaginibacter sp.]
MKTILLAMLAFCCMLTFSCKKDSHNPADDLFIGANKKGTNWLVKYPGTIYTPNKDTLLMHGTKGDEQITLKIPFHGVGTYQLKGDQAIYYTTAGGSAITSQYQPDTTKTNTLTVTSFYVSTGIVKGNFELNLKKITGAPTLDNALSFTNGKLWIELP